MDADGFVCLVVARGGSTSPPRKNLLPIADLPCVQRVIMTVEQWNPSIPIVLSTDDEEIKQVGRKTSAVIIDRPAELATADSPVKLSIKHARDTMRGWGWRVQTMMIQEGNTITLRPQFFSAAVERFFATRADGLFSVVRNERYNPKYLVKLGPDGIVDSLDKQVASNRQQAPQDWAYITGGIDLFQADNFERFPDEGCSSFLGERLVAFPIGEWDAIHIDSEQDLKLVEYLLVG